MGLELQKSYSPRIQRKWHSLTSCSPGTLKSVKPWKKKYSRSWGSTSRTDYFLYPSKKKKRLGIEMGRVYPYSPSDSGKTLEESSVIHPFQVSLALRIKKKIRCLEVPSIQFQAKGMLEAETSGGAHCFIRLYSLNPTKKKIKKVGLVSKYTCKKKKKN